MNKQIDINNLQIITAMPDGLQEWTVSVKSNSV